MANHESSKKAYRQTIKKTLRNKSRASRIKTCIKKVLVAVTSGVAVDAEAALKVAQSEIMRGAKHNIFKANTASRKVSQLAHKVKSIGAVAQ
jgi:small subunit ribosomal protein S20